MRLIAIASSAANRTSLHPRLQYDTYAYVFMYSDDFACCRYLLHPHKPQERLAEHGLVNVVHTRYAPSYIYLEYALANHVILQVLTMPIYVYYHLI